jgi:hypothetical protein
LPPARPMSATAVHGEPDEDVLASVFEDAPDESLWANAVAIWHEVL